MKTNSPVKNGLHVISYPSNPHAMARLRFLPRVCLFFILCSCGTTHKAVQKSLIKETTVDKSISTGTTSTQSVTTEKGDTLIAIKSDTASLGIYIPQLSDSDIDTTSITQEIESGNLKISIQSKPVIVNGKKTGTKIFATAIKKADSLLVVINKTTVTNTQSQTKTDNNIQKTENEKLVNKQVKRTGLNFAGLVFLLGLLLILLFFIYHYLKSKSKL